MKRIYVIVFAVLTSVLSTASAFAQGYGAQATIPFNFRVGNTPLPAGHYRITPESTHVVLLRNLDNLKVAAFSMVTPDAGSRSTTARLAFHRYGDQYFLNRIDCSACAMNVEIPLSKVEKSAMREQAIVRPSDQVFLALK